MPALGLSHRAAREDVYDHDNGRRVHDCEVQVRPPYMNSGYGMIHEIVVEALRRSDEGKSSSFVGLR